MLKMYILVRDSIDPGHAMLAVGHGVLACHREYQTNPVYKDWLNNSFRKVICKVDDKTFEAFKAERFYVLMTESGLNGEETCMVFMPRKEWSTKFKYLQLYK